MRCAVPAEWWQVQVSLRSWTWEFFCPYSVRFRVHYCSVIVDDSETLWCFTVNIWALLQSCAAQLYLTGCMFICLYCAVYISLLMPVTHEGRFSLSAVSDSWWCSSVGPDIRPERWPQTHPSLTWLLFLSRLMFWGKVPPRVPYISPTWPVHSQPTPLCFWPEQTLFTFWLWVSVNVCVGVCFGASGPEEG